MILLDGTIGRLVPTAGPQGVIPANFDSLGTSPSPLANDADLPADADTQFLWVLLPPLPGSGTTLATDGGGYALVDPADGVYTQAYRGLTMLSGGAVGAYESDITTTVGLVVQADFPIAYGVTGAVQRDFSLAYDVLAASGASASAIWNYVLPNGQTAGQNLVAVHQLLLDLHRIHGLEVGLPLAVTPTSRTAGPIAQTISTSGSTTTVSRT